MQRTRSRNDSSNSETYTGENRRALNTLDSFDRVLALKHGTIHPA